MINDDSRTSSSDKDGDRNLLFAQERVQNVYLKLNTKFGPRPDAPRRIVCEIPSLALLDGFLHDFTDCVINNGTEQRSAAAVVAPPNDELI